MNLLLFSSKLKTKPLLRTHLDLCDNLVVCVLLQAMLFPNLLDIINKEGLMIKTRPFE